MKDIIVKSLDSLKDKFNRIDEIALFNQRKVLDSFRKNRLSQRHFVPTTGYGYGDEGRDTLNKCFATVFNAESAIVSPQFTSGTQTIWTALSALLYPNDLLLSVSGKPYDTFFGSIEELKKYSVEYKQTELINDDFDYDAIESILKEDLKRNTVVFITRSRGYTFKNALPLNAIKGVIEFIKAIKKDAIIFVDNCYGEFTNTIEPTEVCADIVAGSLIKNIGGGLAPTGGYIVGKQELIEQISYRVTAPSIGLEVGSYFGGYHLFFEGLFLAPHITAQALKGALLWSKVFSTLGFKCLPNIDSELSDIICSIEFNDKQRLIDFCRAIQSASPVDSFVRCDAWAMPGYDDEVIMASGAFIQGASIELSCDSPIKPPFIAYLQGGLTLEHIIIAVDEALTSLNLG